MPKCGTVGLELLDLMTKLCLLLRKGLTGLQSGFMHFTFLPTVSELQLQLLYVFPNSRYYQSLVLAVLVDMY